MKNYEEILQENLKIEPFKKSMFTEQLWKGVEYKIQKRKSSKKNKLSWVLCTGFLMVLLALFINKEFSHHLDFGKWASQMFSENQMSDGNNSSELAAHLETDIGSRLQKRIDIQKNIDIDNKKIVLFTLKESNNLRIGTAEYSMTKSKKLSYEYAGYGTADIRERVIHTDKGTYFMLAGYSLDKIETVIIYIDGKEYRIRPNQAEGFYLEIVPIEETKANFSSKMVGFNSEGKEMFRINMDHNEIINP